MRQHTEVLWMFDCQSNRVLCGCKEMLLPALRMICIWPCQPDHQFRESGFFLFQPDIYWTVGQTGLLLSHFFVSCFVTRGVWQLDEHATAQTLSDLDDTQKVMVLISSVVGWCASVLWTLILMECHWYKQVGVSTLESVKWDDWKWSLDGIEWWGVCCDAVPLLVW